ncbi:MAG: glycosyltransferase [Clostridium sp.]|nr:glycosyltransferase [Clostridium sp.]
MKKILFVMYDLHMAGAEKALVNLLRACPLERWEVTVLLVKKRGELLEEVPAGITVREMELPEDVRAQILYGSRELLGRYWAERRYRYLASLLFRLALTRGQGVDRKTEGLYRRYGKRLPVLAETFDVAVDYQGQGSFATFYVAKKVQAGRKLSWIHSDFSIVREDCGWLARWYEEYQGIAAVSGQAEESFRKKFPQLAQRARVCHNVIPAERIREEALAYTVPRRPGINVVTIGRLTPPKGYDVILPVFDRLNREGIDFHYFMVGEGEDRELLETMVAGYGLQNRVSLVGLCRNPYPYLRMCDLYLQPSRWEGFCITLAEARLFHKAVLATDFAGAREQIRHRETGILTACREEDLYRELRELLLDGGLRQSLEDASRRGGESLWDAGETISLIEEREVSG